jgi:hypothetical protein
MRRVAGRRDGGSSVRARARRSHAAATTHGLACSFCRCRYTTSRRRRRRPMRECTSGRRTCRTRPHGYVVKLHGARDATSNSSHSDTASQRASFWQPALVGAWHRELYV